MNVLITGATGRVGSRLARHLRARGHEVRALVRKPEAGGALQDAGVKVVIGDLARPDTLNPAVASVDAVVHCAAFFRGATPEQMRATNEDGTLHLARAAVKAGAKRFLFTSTGLVYGTGPGRPAREEDAPAPRSPYPQSKLAAERALLELDGLDVRIVRLAFVYGDGDSHLKDWLPQLRGWPSNRLLQLVHHRDIASAIEALMTAPAVKRPLYNLADDEALTAKAVLEALREPAASVPDAEGEVPFQGVMDAELVRGELGFRSTVPTLRAAISEAWL